MAWRPLTFRRKPQPPICNWTVVRVTFSPNVTCYWTGRTRNTAKTIDNVWTIDPRKAVRFPSEASARWSAENNWATQSVTLRYVRLDLR